MLLEHTGVVNYTVKVEKGCHCESDIMIIADGREIEMKNVPFSKFNGSYLFSASHIVYLLL